MHTTIASARLTFTAWKRRLKAGTELLCVENTKRPELNGKIRIIDRAQVNSMRYHQKGEHQPCWTEYPHAVDATMLDVDTVKWKLVHGNGETVTLRIVKEAM